ncbi:LOB domain-containing protein [Drosera capensis]
MGRYHEGGRGLENVITRQATSLSHVKSLPFGCVLLLVDCSEMRMSCNGCRVLRKGCSETCSIRPCLQWIKSPDSQAHATVFLAKFYGRAGLLNLINSGPDHLRPLIFKSLLYEACGRIINPIHGSVGLLWSGNWQLCQDAVDAVLRGSPIAALPSSDSSSSQFPPLKSHDIRHIAKKEINDSNSDNELHRVRSKPSRFKRTGVSTVLKPKPVRAVAPIAKMIGKAPDELSRGRPSTSRESSMTHQTWEGSLVSAETAAATEEEEVELELCLGFRPPSAGAGRSADVEVDA